MTHFLSRRLATRAAITLATAAAVVVGFGGVAHASTATGTVRTSGGALAVRTGPNSAWDGWDTRANGAKVTLLCYSHGNTVGGYLRTTDIWYMIGSGGFVSAGWVQASGSVNKCRYIGDPPKPNPRSTANGAINWAFARLGSTAHEGYCLRFVAQAYGYDGAGWNTAEIGGDDITNRGMMHTDPDNIPPRGALVWYHNSSGTGHVALSLGEGLVIGTSVNGKVGIAHYKDHSGYRGYSKAYFPYGWGDNTD